MERSRPRRLEAIVRAWGRARWPNPADNERNIAWVRGYWEAIRPHSEAGGYVNFMAEGDGDRIADNYGTNYPRPVEVKRRWDPENLFRMNQNIDPAGGT